MIAAEPRVPLIVNAYEGYSLVSYLITGDGVRVVSWANFMAADSGSKLEWVRRAVRVVAIAGLVLVAWGLDWTLVPYLRSNEQWRQDQTARLALIRQVRSEQAVLERQRLEKERAEESFHAEICGAQQQRVFDSLWAEHAEREADRLLDAFAQNVCSKVLDRARQEIFAQVQRLIQQDAVTLQELRRFEPELNLIEKLPPFKRLRIGFQPHSREDAEFVARMIQSRRHFLVEELAIRASPETLSLEELPGVIMALSLAFPQTKKFWLDINILADDEPARDISREIISSFSVIGQRFSEFQSFRLSFGRANADNALSELVKYAQKITSLNLGDAFLTKKALLSMQKLAFLQNLKFYAGWFGDEPYDREMVELARAAPGLRHLEVRSCKLRKETFSDILFYLPKLETLSIMGSVGEKFEIGAHIRHEALRELDLRGCSVSFADLVTYVERAPALRKVIIGSFFPNLKVGEQHSLRDRFSNLHLLIVNQNFL